LIVGILIFRFVLRGHRIRAAGLWLGETNFVVQQIKVAHVAPWGTVATGARHGPLFCASAVGNSFDLTRAGYAGRRVGEGLCWTGRRGAKRQRL
jgi:hypothetical protein